MKPHPFRTALSCVLILCAATLTLNASQTRTLTYGWLFQMGEHQPGDFDSEFDPSLWKPVTVPHDWAIAGPFDNTPDIDGSTGRLPWKGVARYRIDLQIPETESEMRHYLDFDGVMASPKIYLNGKLAGEWDYGYTPFRIDISDQVTPGESNVLVIEVDTRDWYSRWYPGAGLYRKVQLVASNPTHFAKWGVFSRLTDPEKTDSLHVEAQIENHATTSSSVTLQFELLDGLKPIEQGRLNVVVAAQDSAEVSTQLMVKNPILWDVENPHLYTLKTSLEQDGEIIDTVETPVGIRTIRFTANDGFFLNGKRLQFKGVNLHHDLGPLGAAFNKSAARRQLEIMQSMGVNALRTSHNPPAAEVLELCDELGIVVWDEAFDKWDRTAGRRAVDDPPLNTFGKRQLEAYMLRDRNHPSVIVWSIGNELSGGPMGITPENVSLMTSFAKEIDDSRPIGMGCHIPPLSYGGNFDALDLAGWNYARRYMDFRGQYPDKPILYSESASTVSTRGYYAFPLPVRHTDMLESHQVSSYDLTSAAWSDIPDAEFKLMAQDDWVHGEFVWTGIDYIGEPTPYTMQARSSYFGIVDLCGFEKDRYYLYKSHWNSEETTIHILPHWNWPDRIGKKVPVFVYTNGDSAELFLNGVSQGIRRKGELPTRPQNWAQQADIAGSGVAEGASLSSLSDGDPDTIWAASQTGRGQWLKLDLKEVKKVGYLSLYFEEPEKFYGYSVWGSEDGENWRYLLEKDTSMFPRWDGPKRIYHELDGNYRFIRIKFNKLRQDDRNRTVALREIGVYSEPCESDYYDVTYDYRLRWNDVVYEPGEVKVVAYKEGKVLGERSMYTVGAPVSIRLTADKETINASQDELAFITVEVLDAEGNPSPVAENLVQFELNENGSIAGTGNGNPLSLESFQSESQSLWAGKALLIVRATPDASGPIKIKATAVGLESAETSVQIEME